MSRIGLAQRARASIGRRTAHLPPTVQGLLWSACSGALFCVLNATMRGLTLDLHPLQAQFLRYVFGVMAMLPMVLHHGLAAYRPNNMAGQFTRGAVHTVGLVLWFLALPHVPLADTTAIGFTTPLFIMLGAYFFLREAMRWERWAATAVGFVGVLIVLAPKLMGSAVGGTVGSSGGTYHLLMLASAPVFAASFLITKVLVRSETPAVIVVWQAISVALLSLPMAVLVWRAPSMGQWLGFAVCGVLGSAGHFCLTNSFRVADISSTQSVKFLDLLWASLLGWLMFTELPTQTTLLGGVVICASTLWVARREHRRAALHAAARLDKP